MKKLLDRATKTLSVQRKNTPAPARSPASPGLQPKFTVPPVPHPAPHTHLAVLATSDGLLIKPHIVDSPPTESVSYLRISWGSTVHVEEITNSDDQNIAWSDSIIVYGLLGALPLFSDSYILVITSKSDIGTLLESSHTVHGVTGVTAIPLVEERARVVLNTLASKASTANRPPMRSSPTMDSLAEENLSSSQTLSEDAKVNKSGSTSPKVQFSTSDQIKVLTPTPSASTALDESDRPIDRSPSPSPSDASIASSESSPATSVAQAVVSRLSFWNTIIKPTTSTSSNPSGPEANSAPESIDIDTAIQEGNEPSAVLGNILGSSASEPITAQEKHTELEDKVVRECIREFTKGGMYFAYNFDLTRSLQHKQEQIEKSRKQNALLDDLLRSDVSVEEPDNVRPFDEPFPTLPLWRRVDRQYWWNEWLSKPFVDGGFHSYVLPVMQGYCQRASFTIPPNIEMQDVATSVEYLVISRRSKDRAGLRYQRRGVDDDAHVANFVETETIMQVVRDNVTNIFAYVQVRGSIPLFWTQTGYGLKPPPVLAANRTHDQNLHAMRRHFERTIPQYGPHTIVNLAEQNGKEGAITTAYRTFVAELDNKDAEYNEYDFHHETKGMKYENISKLISTMERVFDHQGFLWISGNTVMSKQTGVYRVNCIDCLDRTNVVQSAFARHVLRRQLGAVAILNPAVDGLSEMDTVFNDVWANNGDAISRAYAGTSALKGDFTRTGKRDLGGMLNDGVNSLARMYSSTFSDWFCQAVIDFMLGNRTLSVFSEFLLKLQSTDPGDLHRISKIRAEAIATSVERVLSEGERLLGGWTMFAPEALGVKMGDKFEEKVLLLTAQALYIISFDYTLEKVKIYTRVPLGDIVGITKGAYILSPLEEASRDPIQNAGFVVKWLSANQTSRVTSYSYRNRTEPASTPTSPVTEAPPPVNNSNRLSMTFGRAKAAIPPLSNLLDNVAGQTANETSFAAFKMLPIDPTRSRASRVSSMGDREPVDDILLNGATNCKQAVDYVVDYIRKACEDVGNVNEGFVTEEDIVSLAEAQRVTSVYAKMEYGVKRLLWLGG